eukprot:4063306-Pyramimonas_sp.AAC.1
MPDLSVRVRPSFAPDLRWPSSPEARARKAPAQPRRGVRLDALDDQKPAAAPALRRGSGAAP